VTVKRAERHEILYAAIPLLFAVQQLIEGGLWLALPAHISSMQFLTTIYLIFANIIWPTFVPLAILMLEPSKLRRKLLLIPFVAGALTAAFFIAMMVQEPVSAAIIGSHIHYDFPHPHDKIAFAFYATATCLAPLLSSHKAVRLLGATLIFSMVASYVIYAIWFASIWCYFAALISMIVLIYFRRQPVPGIVQQKELPA
jgi:hypothetical protein